MQLQIFSFLFIKSRETAHLLTQVTFECRGESTLLVWEIEHSVAHMSLYVMAISEIDF